MKSARTRLAPSSRSVVTATRGASDWRMATLARIRALIREAEPGVVEDLKWRSVPVWSRGRPICTGETYESVVKMTFFRGASLADPAHLFNASLDGRVRRAIDLREGEMVDENALKDLVRAAVALDESSPRTGEPPGSDRTAESRPAGAHMHVTKTKVSSRNTRRSAARAAPAMPGKSGPREKGTESLRISFTVDRSPHEVFDAINDVRGWWTGEIVGTTDRPGAEFTYRHGKIHESTQRITELVQGKRIVWRVLDAHLDFVRDGAEWKGTDIVFEIGRKGDRTEVRFTHVGLSPRLECYDRCSDAWGFFIRGSLRRRITTGKREPLAKPVGPEAHPD